MIRYLYGDCLVHMKNISDNSIDMCLTDPPYGIVACKWDSVIPFEPMWKELKRIVKDNGAIALFGSEPFSSHLRLSNIKMFKYDWYWRKSKAGNFAICKKQPLKHIEVISIFYRKFGYYDTGAKPLDKPVLSSRNNKGSNLHSGKIPQKKGKYFQTMGGYNKNIIEFANPSGRGHFHPTQKPVLLLEYLIKTYTLKNEIILDFTMGSGSTGIACINTNRNFIGIEKELKYYNIAKERIEKAICQKK